MRRIALFGVAWLLSGASARAQELRWQPAQDRPVATLGTPAVATLGKPQSLARKARGAADDTPALAVPEPGGYQPPPGYSPPPPYYPPPPGYAPAPYPYYPPPPGYAPYPYYVAPTSNYPAAPADPLTYAPISPSPKLKGDGINRTSFSSRSTRTSYQNFEEQTHDWCDSIMQCFTSDNRNAFESDHSLDTFASPVTNPFYFEDPRALTEIKPLFIYQKVPGSNSVLQGGSAYFYGFQGRVALTDRWSVTLNKIGGVNINPSNGLLQDASGLSEIHLGPKFTFVRNPESGTAAAIGLIFEIPCGPAKVYQDTGDFSMTPYFSIAQRFGRSSYGSFNFMDTFGLSLAVSGSRSDFFYNSMHLDFDVGNAHKFYPFLELNWFHYTQSGDSRPITEEGRDFANIGAFDVSGNDYVTLAPGFRYKFSEKVQVGMGFEFPLTDPKDFQDFRLTVDFIFRY